VLEPFGVEVLRDLSQPLTADEEDQFRDLFNQHGLILARGQSLTMERQREVCALLGPILDRQGETGYMTNELGGASSSAYCWHSDAAYTKAPFDALALHALDVVDDASSTCFASAETAFDALPGELVQALDAHEQEMIAPHQDKLAERTCDQREPFGYKRGVRPSVFTNPHNDRRCVWVNEMQTVRLLDMEWEASRDLLHQVYDRIYDPANVLEHRWRNGDIVIWDNIALQHARGDLGQAGKRLLQRVIVGTEGVVPFIGK
jgi:taurine dioxygenase